MRCDQCEMLSINGHACHETGCPNASKTWVEERQEWVKFVDCHECGYPVEVGESCDCQTPVEEEEDEEPETPYACPKCGDTDQIDVEITTYARLVQSSPDDFQTDLDESDDHDHTWDKDSTMICRACDHVGTAGEFDTAKVNA